MTWEMDMLRREEYAAAQAEKEAMTSVIRRMADAKLGLGDMERLTGLSVNEITMLAKNHNIVLQ